MNCNIVMCLYYLSKEIQKKKEKKCKNFKIILRCLLADNLLNIRNFQYMDLRHISSRESLNIYNTPSH